MAIELPALPFERTALEPHISGETIDFHYGKHHKAYVDNLNKAVELGIHWPGEPIPLELVDEAEHRRVAGDGVVAGGQVKSMLSWLGYMKHGEPQERDPLDGVERSYEWTLRQRRARPRPEDARVAAVEDEMRHPLGMAHRVRDRDRAPLGDPEQRERLAADVPLGDEHVTMDFIDRMLPPRAVWPRRPSFSASTRMERNFISVNARPFLPTRSCLYSTGPRESILIRMAVTIAIGKESKAPIRAMARCMTTREISLMRARWPRLEKISQEGRIMSSSTRPVSLS